MEKRAEGEDFTDLWEDICLIFWQLELSKPEEHGMSLLFKIS